MASPTVAIAPTFHNTEWSPAGKSEIRPDMLFREAGEVYIQSRMLIGTEGMVRSVRGPHYVRPTTLYNYRQNVRSLGLFFGEMRLSDIRLDHIKKYQRVRSLGEAPFVRYRRPQDAKPRIVKGIEIPAKGEAPCPTKPQHVNQELCLLRTIMRRALLWDQTSDDYYEELEGAPNEMPRALSKEEQRSWLEVSSSRLRWHVVHWYSVLAFATCMSTNEIRALRLGDVDLENRVLNVPPEGAKNVYRNRTIPLEREDVHWAIRQLRDRAHRLGATEPMHYLFPFAQSKLYDPTRSMSNSGLKKLWQEVREATGLLQFRPYDTRHTAITRMAEVGTPITIIMAFAGHISPRMTMHYTHISEQMKVHAMRQTQNLQEGKPAQQSTARRRVVTPIPQIAAQHGTVSTFTWGLSWTGMQEAL
jgi:integrase